MATFKAIASAALLVASATWADAFAPMTTTTTTTTTIARIPSHGVLGRTAILFPDTILCATTSGVDDDSSPTPCEAPSDVEAALLEDASALRESIVTNIKGERVSLGDAMTTKNLSEKTYDTSVVVFLRHMG